MLGIQVSIGALNDLVDAPLDAAQKPRKPIPSGLVSRRAAGIVAGSGAITGIVLSAVSGPATVVAALGCLGLGYAYDLRLSRTVISWLPLSVALPLLPIHAWLGVAGTIPTGLITLVPIGVLGGAGLAIANGLVDVERDARGGRRAVAVALGPRAAWAAQTLALGCAAALAVLLAPAITLTAPDPARIDLEVLRTVRTGGIWLGIALLAAGAAVLRAGSASLRERGWEMEAVGIASLGLGWLAATAGAVAGGRVGA
jgi:4-hydroxybenzoate polyprenyltransferase